MTLRTLLQVTADGMILSGLRKTITAKIHLTANLSLAATTNPWMAHATNGNMGHGLVWLGDNLRLAGRCLGSVFLSEKPFEDAHGVMWANL